MTRHGILGGVTAGGSCGPFGLRERKKAHTREAIIDAAVELFERNGFDATTVEDIAAAADVSPRTFFRYFDSKLDVVMADKQADQQQLDALIEARPAAEGPIEAVRHVLRGELGRVLADDRGLLMRQYRLVMTTPSLRALALEHFHEHQDELARGLAARLGVDDAALRPHVIAAAVATTAWTVIDRWVVAGAQPDRLLPMIDEGFALLESGFDLTRTTP
jgi:AcrR family transcriptional regulator